MKIALYDLTLDELTRLVEEWGEPAYRARQIWHWLYRQLATDPAEMDNLPLSLRQRLSQDGEIGRTEAVAVERSSDGETEKRLLQLADGETIETVLMKYRRRNTLCISSQVGCAMGCVFCATGQMGFRRNLTTGEIVSQVLTFERELRLSGERLTNVVLMGMGEPLRNYEAVVRAVRRAGAKVDSSTGIHVHVDAARFDARGVRNLVKIVNKQESLIEHALGISQQRRLRWCRGVNPDFLARLERRLPRSLQQLNALWYGRENNHPAHHDSSRYHGLNLHNIWFRGTVEFRWF